MKPFSIIVALNEKNGIGLNNEIPWKCPEDLNFFKKMTENNIVIMGRKTWESLPYRPLRNRINIVLSRNNMENLPENTYHFSSLEKALSEENIYENGNNNIFVIGGSEIYEQALKLNCEKIYLTRIFNNCECDKYFNLDTNWCMISSSDKKYSKNGNVVYQFQEFVYRPQNISEEIYLNTVRDIISTGSVKNDRTGVGTISKFGVQMRYELENQFPLFTTKRVPFRIIAEELLWFINGSTDSELLNAKNVKIWNANGSREFLDQQGFKKRKVGDLGPVYGFQWRHFGAEYVDSDTEYSGQGIDQLQNCISMIKNNPDSRRIILCAWNPVDIPKMALPPCHTLCQFYVCDNKLSCQLYQRSGDMGLGVPFNVASYSLLTYMIAHITGLKPGEFVHTIGDAHVYTNHVEPLMTQLKRKPYKYPILEITRQVDNIDDFKMSDFKLIDYKCHKTVKMKMAV